MRTMNSAGVLDRLQLNLQGRSHADLARFQIINLDRVRERAGDQWETLKRKVTEVSAHFIEKRIGNKDVLIHCHEGFLVVFAALDEADAEARTEEIARELHSFFIGDDLLRPLNIRSRSARMDADQVCRMMSGSAKLDPIPATARAEKAGSATDPADPETSDRAPTPGCVREVVYQPVWDAQQEAVTTQFCTSRLIETRTGRTLYGRDTLRGHGGAKDNLELDQFVADHALKSFGSMIRCGRRTSICVPVAMATLTTRATRVKMFETLASVPAELRPLLFLRIEGIDEGTPASTVQDIFRTLNPFSASLVAEIAGDPSMMERFNGCGATVFSVRTPAAGLAGAGSCHRREWLHRFVRGAQRYHVAPCLSGSNDPADVVIALKQGVRFVSGLSITDDQLQPVAPYMFTQDDLYRRAAQRHLV